MIVTTDIFRNFTCLAIDPGLTTCGISLFKIRELQLASVDAFTILTDKVSFNSEYREEFHSTRVIRMNQLCLAYHSVLSAECPIIVCCEAPFYNSRMPSAYGSLMETVTALRLVTNNFNVGIPFVLYSPQEVKQSFKRAGQIGKLVMSEALAQNTQLVSKITRPIQTLDEHSVDAIAVGYTWYLSQFGRSF